MEATIYRKDGEHQRPFVRRILQEQGRFSVMDALYNCRYVDGRATAVTRLAARICELRSEGMAIEERRAGPLRDEDIAPRFMTSEYVLVSSPHRVVEEREPWPTAWLELREHRLRR